MVQVSTHAARGFIPMMELIDRDKELARLNKEKAKAEKELAMFEKQLSNPKFVEKAPAVLVEETRAPAAATSWPTSSRASGLWAKAGRWATSTAVTASPRCSG